VTAITKIWDSWTGLGILQNRYRLFDGRMDGPMVVCEGCIVGGQLAKGSQVTDGMGIMVSRLAGFHVLPDPLWK
jgi:hypothetical protein